MNTDDERREEYTRKVLGVGASGYTARITAGKKANFDDANAAVAAVAAATSAAAAEAGGEAGGGDETLSRSDLMNVLNGSVLCMFEPTDLNDLRRENSIQLCSFLTHSHAYQGLRQHLLGVPFIGWLLAAFCSSSASAPNNNNMNEMSIIETPMSDCLRRPTPFVVVDSSSNDIVVDNNNLATGATTKFSSSLSHRHLKHHDYLIENDNDDDDDVNETTRLTLTTTTAAAAAATSTSCSQQQPSRKFLPPILSYSIESLNQSINHHHGVTGNPAVLAADNNNNNNPMASFDNLHSATNKSVI